MRKKTIIGLLFAACLSAGLVAFLHNWVWHPFPALTKEDIASLTLYELCDRENTEYFPLSDAEQADMIELLRKVEIYPYRDINPTRHLVGGLGFFGVYFSLKTGESFYIYTAQNRLHINDNDGWCLVDWEFDTELWDFYNAYYDTRRISPGWDPYRYDEPQIIIYSKRLEEEAKRAAGEAEAAQAAG